MQLLPPANEVWDKVIFLQTSVHRVGSLSRGSLSRRGGHCPRWSLSRGGGHCPGGSLSREWDSVQGKGGICPGDLFLGGLCQGERASVLAEDLCLGRGSLFRGEGLYSGWIGLWESLSRGSLSGVSIWGVPVQGSLSSGVSVQGSLSEGSLSRGSLSRGSLSGESLSRGSLSRQVSVWVVCLGSLP